MIVAPVHELCIGWSPVTRSMTRSRRTARPRSPRWWYPALSGPRCASASAMRTSVARSVPPGRMAPAIPHMRAYPREGPSTYSIGTMRTLGSRRIPADLTMSAPDIGPRERELDAEVMNGTQLTFGPKVERFETGVAASSGRRFGIAVSSGTAGLHVAVRALALSRGDRVVTTAFSFVSSTNCLLYEDVDPHFADIDPVTFNIDPAAVEAAIAASDRP